MSPLFFAVSSAGFFIFVFMETIPKNECLKIGYLQKPYGVKGAVILQFEPEYMDSLSEEPVLFLEIGGLLVPWFLSPEGVRFRSAESALLQFDWVENEQQARQICGSSIYIKKEDWLHDKEHVFLHHLEGFVLIDKNIGVIGPIEKIEDYAGNLLFQVTYKGSETLVPFNEDFLVRFDEDKKEIVLNCPEGIFQVNS